MAWELKEYERAMYKIIDVIDENGKVIKTFVADDLDYSRKKKQAQLMAAAPELLEAAEYSLKQLSYSSLTIETTLIHKAINKANGDGENT